MHPLTSYLADLAHLRVCHALETGIYATEDSQIRVNCESG